MLYALNDPLASFVFMYCIIVWKCMLKCVLRVRIKIYIYNAVKQGAVLSPILFSMYIDSLLEKLKDSGLGCHVGRTFAGAFAYAYDIALVSPSLSGLRQMIQICEQYAMEYYIIFNPVKSKLMCFNSVSSDKPYLHCVVTMSMLLIIICI